MFAELLLGSIYLIKELGKVANKISDPVYHVQLSSGKSLSLFEIPIMRMNVEVTSCFTDPNLTFKAAALFPY